MLPEPKKQFPQPSPTQIAEYFSTIQDRFGHKFDFSIKSLETEVDRFLEENTAKSQFLQFLIEPLLTAYIGETLCRLYGAKWQGHYSSPVDAFGSNYYLCYLKIGEMEIWPSHFIECYLSNGKKSEGSFSDFWSEGLLPQIQNALNPNTKPEG